jgi:hypothetical protein
MHRPIRRFIMVSHRGSIPWGRAGGFSGAEAQGLCTGTVVEREREGRAWICPIEPTSGFRRAADRGIMVGGVERKDASGNRKPGAFLKLGPEGSGRTPRVAVTCSNQESSPLYLLP